MSISGVGASNLYAIAETSYGAVPSITTGNVLNIAVRPGAIPSESTSRVSGRVVGGFTDRGRTHRVRSTVAGTFSFNIGNNSTNSNKIHEMAGVSANSGSTYDDQYSNLKSYSMWLPMIEEGATPAGVAISGLLFNGMMVSQYTISLPNDNSLIDCSLGFVGRNIVDDSLGGTVSSNWTSIANSDDIKQVGQPFETWTAAIQYDGVSLSVSSFSINIANTLTPASFVTSGKYIGKPTPSMRNVTGSFSVPYSSDATAGGYKGLLNRVLADATNPDQLTIVAKSTRDTTKAITITMPEVEIITGQTVNNLSPGYVPMSFSFKAFGSQSSNTDQEINIVNT